MENNNNIDNQKFKGKWKKLKYKFKKLNNNNTTNNNSDNNVEKYRWSQSSIKNNLVGQILTTTTTANDSETIKEGINLNELPIELIKKIIENCLSLRASASGNTTTLLEIVDHPMSDPMFMALVTTCRLWRVLATSVIESFKLDRPSRLPSPLKLQQLKRFRGLKTINILGGDALGCFHINVLCDVIVNTNFHLERINLFSNKIGDSGLVRLAKALDLNNNVSATIQPPLLQQHASTSNLFAPMAATRGLTLTNTFILTNLTIHTDGRLIYLNRNKL
ncbi:hypothetical protein DFA_04788 [Cavenderia fasciculata]|uniref:Uncharacterized protein n=1 Tax=Cavenderia fasciculata TaxID=261658 RepID=F4PNX9_CACFS|nr:uncharacterized protein DFA_04788 [Cavenderia fasciculata]EGG22658.1 hypothetical protein DFA_04788 [Cavenderia fasciculata]|eukprot:XP_004360509.1 hypothetical protein DFA_04788 [Cavenderia fasciculata]